MKKLLVFIFIILITNLSYADIFEVPFSGYPKEIQAKFKANGMKLDLSGSDRDKDSWGFLENKGTEIFIHTYSSPTDEERVLLLELLKGE